MIRDLPPASDRPIAPVFRPGDCVVCVDADFPLPLWRVFTDVPEYGVVYTIREVGAKRREGRGRVTTVIRLVEVRSECRVRGLGEPWWDAARFVLRDPGEATPEARPEQVDLDELLALWQASPCRITPWLESFSFTWAESSCAWFDLALDVPALAYFAARHTQPLPSKHRHWAVDHLSRMKRRDLCAELGFPASHACVSALKKFGFPEPSVLARPDAPGARYWLDLLRELLLHEPESLRLMNDLETVHRKDIARLMCGCERAEVMLPPASLENAKWFCKIPAVRRLDLAMRFDRTMNPHRLYYDSLIKPARPPGAFRNEKKARAYLKEREAAHALLEDMLETTQGGSEFQDFPDPPLPGSKRISPISTPQAVLDEANEMKNCLMLYTKLISLGLYYVYRIESPVRVSVGLHFIRGRWELDGYAGRDNVPVPSRRIQRLILAWLDRHEALRCKNRSSAAQTILDRLAAAPPEVRKHYLPCVAAAM